MIYEAAKTIMEDSGLIQRPHIPMSSSDEEAAGGQWRYGAGDGNAGTKSRNAEGKSTYSDTWRIGE
jgi:hypothetical protein